MFLDVLRLDNADLCNFIHTHGVALAFGHCTEWTEPKQSGPGNGG